MTVDEALKLTKKYVAKWQHVATSYCWRVDVHHHRQARAMPDGCENDLGFAYGMYQYMRGGIHLNLELLSEKEEDEIEETIVHEFCHFLLFPMQSHKIATKETELCVTMIARTLLDVQCQDPKAHKKK